MEKMRRRNKDKKDGKDKEKNKDEKDGKDEESDYLLKL